MRSTRSTKAPSVAKIGPAMRPDEVAVLLRRDKDGPELGREPVAESDLSDVFSEMWMDRWLRRGLAEVPLESLTQQIIPGYGASDAVRCARFTLEASDPLGRDCRRDYTLELFQDVASRGSQRLLAEGLLKSDDVYYYEVVVGGGPRAAGPGPFKVTPKKPPLVFRDLPLKPLMERARQVGNLDERWFHVFFTERALADAEHFSRKGAAVKDPIETGAVLCGPLCSCPDSGEMFAVVCDVLEAKDAEGSSFSLTYSGLTWRRIQAVISAKQADPATRAHRIIGQAHGHNVRPDFHAGEGHGACQTCPKQKTCRLTSVFVSQDDRTWTRAVFSRQPWQLGLIYGHDARGGNTHALFGLRDNRLAERGYHVIPDFDPEEWGKSDGAFVQDGLPARPTGRLEE
jgi:hypothetical protein